MKRPASMVQALTLAVTLAGLAACVPRPYCVDCDEEVAATTTPDAASEDAPGGFETQSFCAPSAEVCNGKDDDCNGLIDDGIADVGAVCGSDKGLCKKGVLSCTDGKLICMGEVLPQAESCNGLDDDCDGTVDNGNPGAGVLCGNGTGDCVQGVTACVNGAVACQGGVGPKPEVCDGHDNNCDGQIDEGDPGGGAMCGEGPGICVPGKIHCTGGQLACVGAGPAIAEICNGIDDNCNGQIDEGFNTAIDPNNCGSCNHVCSLPFAKSTCAAGACEIEVCLPDHWDLDHDPSNGCEYDCVFRGTELCNGVDDDCDGVTDNGVTAPDTCAKQGECAGTKPTCDAAQGWVCHYGAKVSTNMLGQIVPETTCDDRDNDCNGITDDLFPNRGKDCTSGLGACVQHGSQVCNTTHDGLACNAPTPPAGTPEVCNGIDDDCDGHIDNGAPDAWATITVAGVNKQMYQYEASHPDATAAAVGALTNRSCSTAGRVPWINVTYPQAQVACAAAGARLCTEAEWQTACETPAPTTCDWSFANNCSTYQVGICNDGNNDLSTMLPGVQNGLLPTGSLATCYSDWGAAGGIYDLSGNVKEWAAARSPGINPLRGGAYNNPPYGATCDASFVVADDTFLFADVGFRCCKD